ncbi:DUF2934 domain-containing protein [Methyloglobulus sp.]|uniref:DUF2934 domain-containing protein n=1 Tax=Methyloglobulus sp. TaxID=2518622 RepID=UPI00398A438C
MENVTRHQWISEAAYYKAEARNFAPGRELDDWLAAENEYVKMHIALYLSMAEEDGAMTILGLQQLAKSVGVENPECINLKIELIQSIQNATHHRPCFRTAPGKTCQEEDCKWRSECKKLIAEWSR